MVNVTVLFPYPQILQQKYGHRPEYLSAYILLVVIVEQKVLYLIGPCNFKLVLVKDEHQGEYDVISVAVGVENKLLQDVSVTESDNFSLLLPFVEPLLSKES